MKVSPELIERLKTMKETMSYVGIERATGIERRKVKKLVEMGDKVVKKPIVKSTTKILERMTSVAALRKLEAKKLPPDCFNVFDKCDWLTG